VFCFSQQQQFFPVRQDSVKLQNFLKIGTSLFDAYIGAEFAIVKDFTVNVETGFSAIGFKVRKVQNDYREEKNSWRMHFNEDMRFYFAKTELKWNYSFRKRHKEWKETSGNSSDYFALEVKYIDGLLSSSSDYSKKNELNNIIFYDFHLGFQREMGYNLVLNFFFGYGYMFDFQTELGSLAPSFGLKVNYHLIKF